MLGERKHACTCSPLHPRVHCALLTMTAQLKAPDPQRLAESGAWLQVVAILEAGHPLPFTVKAANLDLPELQGEPLEIAKEKCRLAAQQVHCQP